MFDRIVSRIHDAALEPERWPDVLERISRRFDAAILLSQVRPDRMSEGDFWSHRFDLEVIATTPVEAWHAEDNRTLRRIKAAPICHMSDRRAFLPDADMDRDPAGRHFFGRSGLFHAVVGTLQRDDEAISCCTLGRPTRAPAFETDEVLRIQHLAREIGRAMRLHRALRRSEMRTTVFSAAIDRLSQGVILTDHDLRVLHVNAAADAMIETGHGIRLRHGRLALCDRAAQRRLDAAARALARAEGSHPEIRLFAPRGLETLPFSLRVFPALGGATCSVAPRAGVIVLVDDPELTLSGLTPDRLAADYGLTTAEGRVAALAAETMTVAAIADALGLSANTVKTHLKAVYGKVGVQSQAALVRQFVARTPPSRA